MVQCRKNYGGVNCVNTDTYQTKQVIGDKEPDLQMSQSIFISGESRKETMLDKEDGYHTKLALWEEPYHHLCQWDTTLILMLYN